MSDGSEQPSGPPRVPPPSPWAPAPAVGQVPPATWGPGTPPGPIPAPPPPPGWSAPGPAPEGGSSGAQPRWLPGTRREAHGAPSAPGSPVAALLGRPAPELAALAAVLAAGLLCLASLARTLFVPAGDFGLSLGDRIRAGTDVLVLDLPLVLAVALVTGALGTGADRHRPLDLGVLGAGATGSLLLLLRLLAHLFADDRVLSGGGAERLAASLVDLAALVLTVALTWWASRRRRERLPVPDTGPPPGTWAQGPPPPGTSAPL